MGLLAMESVRKKLKQKKVVKGLEAGSNLCSDLPVRWYLKL